MAEQQSVYLRLFHGRRCLNQDLDDWGSDGPILGPLSFVHTTYGSMIHLDEPESPWDTLVDLTVVGGCVYYDGVYYGDWSVFVPAHLEGVASEVQTPDEAKAKLP